MIQISSVPVANLPILTDPLAEGGTEPTISGEFSALLAAQIATPSADGTPLPADFAQPPAKLQGSIGKPGGKGLPLPAILAATFKTEAAIEPATGLQDSTDSAGQADLSPPPEALELQTASLSLPLAGLVPAINLHGQPSPAGSERSGCLPGRQASFPAPMSSPPAQVPPVMAQLQAPSPQPDIAPQTGSSLQVDASAMTSRPMPRLPGLQGPVPNIVLEPVQTQPQVGLQANTLLPANAPAVVQAVAPVLVAQVQPKPGRTKVEVPATLLPSRVWAEAASTGDTRTDLPIAPVPSVQPMPAMPQDPGAASAAATVTAPSNNRVEAPADFSALVDRLVAAREAAQGSLAPHAVHAAVAHAEFGQVSLRFEQQDGGLSVAMTSPDPDFARSVLAAAPNSQQGADNTDGRGSYARQDGGQSLAQPQTQAQGQANGHGTQRQPSQLHQAGSQPDRPSTPNSAGDSNDPATERRGIFA